MRFTPVRALVAVRPKPAIGAKALAEATAAASRTVLSMASPGWERRARALKVVTFSFGW